MGIGTTRIEHGNLLTPRQAINRTSRGDGETGDSRAPNDPSSKRTGGTPGAFRREQQGRMTLAPRQPPGHDGQVTEPPISDLYGR